VLDVWTSPIAISLFLVSCCRDVYAGSVTDHPTTGPDGNDVYQSPSAPPHVVIGSAGALQEESWMKPQPEWSAVRFANGAGHFYTDTFGYGSLRVSGVSELLCRPAIIA